ncbi:MAG: hypothetical protein IJR61_07055 [Clostridia bacterium]|nr:hypothetical protein [Clostridia bacterium]
MKKFIALFYITSFILALSCTVSCIDTNSQTGFLIPENAQVYDFISYEYYHHSAPYYNDSEFFNNAGKTIVAIKTSDELQTLISEEEKLWTSTPYLNETDPCDFMKKLRSYGEDYFENNMLILIHFTAGSGSFRYKSFMLYKTDEGTVTLIIADNTPNTDGVTDDIMFWTIITECEQLDFTAVDYSIVLFN